jgi:sec-independent protein translocase protein TatB
MFDISWGELILIGMVALIAIGPKELPGALRTLGQWMTKIRRMASDFQNQFQEAMREAEMADLKKQVDTLTSGFDPIETARREIESAVEDKPPSALATPEQTTTPAPAADAPSAFAPGVADTDSPPARAAPPGAAPASAPSASTDTDKALALDEPGAAKPGDRPA